MAARKLATYVHVHRADGTTEVYGPEDTVPAEDAKLIFNKKAWADDKADSKADSSK